MICQGHSKRLGQQLCKTIYDKYENAAGKDKRELF